MNELVVQGILSRLKSADRQAAWRDFLEIFSEDLLRAIRAYANDADQVSDCYVFICEKLSEREHRRLLSFVYDGRAQFQTWLNSVVCNLCVDWLRTAHGRVRPYRMVEGLTDLDKAVFKHRFAANLPLGECLNTLREEFHDLSFEGLNSSIRRIAAMLTSRQRSLLATQAARDVSSRVVGADTANMELVDSEPGPASNAAEDEEKHQLQIALNQVSSDDQLLLRLRFEQDLTLGEIARLVGLRDPFRAKRALQAALHRLKIKLSQL